MLDYCFDLYHIYDTYDIYNFLHENDWLSVALFIKLLVSREVRNSFTDNSLFSHLHYDISIVHEHVVQISRFSSLQSLTFVGDPIMHDCGVVLFAVFSVHLFLMLAPMDLGFGHVFVAFFNKDSITVSLKLPRLYNCSVELSHRLASCEVSSQGTADIVPQESDDILKVNIWDKNMNNNYKMVLLCWANEGLASCKKVCYIDRGGSPHQLTGLDTLP